MKYSIYNTILLETTPFVTHIENIKCIKVLFYIR